MSYLHRFKTSARISLVFSLFNLVSLIILLVAINISYFFIWYTDQKDASFYDMNVNYQSLISTSTSDNTEAFRQYILQKDTVILPPDDAPMVCSNGVSKKIHGDIANLQNRYFYTEGDTTYFIYSQNYEGIGEVKVFFDTTPYVTSQLIIIKMSTIIILIFLLAYFFLGRWVSRYALKGLQTIAVSAKKMASGEQIVQSKIPGPEDDEIRVLSDTIEQAFSKIQKQTETMRQFITDVSHEFKTPIQVMHAKIDVCQKMSEARNCTAENYMEALQTVKQQTKKLNQLLETLFFLSRVQEGITTFTKEPVNISHYVREKVMQYKEQYGIEIEVHIVSGVKKEIETTTFDIMLDNLVSNAVKFSLAPVHLRIELSEESLSVEDFGVGIEAKNLEKIWEKFYRNDTGKEGFGIGLFLVQRLVKLYGWEITVQSEAGKGTTFTIHFSA